MLASSPKSQWRERNGVCFSICHWLCHGDLIQAKSHDNSLSVCLSVCLFVQAFRAATPKRLVVSRRGFHRWVDRFGGQMMGGVGGRHVPRGTCHVQSADTMQKKSSGVYSPNGKAEPHQTWWVDGPHSGRASFGGDVGVARATCF